MTHLKIKLAAQTPISQVWSEVWGADLLPSEAEWLSSQVSAIHLASLPRPSREEPSELSVNIEIIKSFPGIPL